MKDSMFSDCKFSADLVPYLYAELPASRIAAFESHLPDCVECTDQFAELSIARYEVYDWKKLEFDGLETPHFAIPFEKEEVVTASSWADKLKAALAPKWAVPGAVFATLAVASVITGIFVFSGNDSAEGIARVDNVNTPAAAVAAEKVTERPSAVVQNEAVTHERSEAQTQRANVTSNGRTARQRTARKANLPSRQPDMRQASARREQKSFPRLNEFNDDEDTSLRLAELFDDFETRN